MINTLNTPKCFLHIICDAQRQTHVIYYKKGHLIHAT